MTQSSDITSFFLEGQTKSSDLNFSFLSLEIWRLLLPNINTEHGYETRTSYPQIHPSSQFASSMPGLHLMISTGQILYPKMPCAKCCRVRYASDYSIRNLNKRRILHPRAALPEESFIGIARCITDFTTFIYLTDVYIEPSSQGNGLGTWMMKCVQEVIESMPHLRRSLLFTGDWKRSVPFYEKILGMQVFESGRGEDGEGRGVAVMMRKGNGYRQRPEFDA